MMAEISSSKGKPEKLCIKVIKYTRFCRESSHRRSVDTIESSITKGFQVGYDSFMVPAAPHTSSMQVISNDMWKYHLELEEHLLLLNLIGHGA
jgi:hypothetical protein